MPKEQASIRLDPAIKAAAAEAAGQDRRTLSQWIELLIVEELKRRGRLPPAT